MSGAPKFDGPVDSAELMQRRELLRRVAWIMGGAVSAPLATAILQGCSSRDAAPAAAAWTPKFLKPAQVELVSEIAEIMIPKTTTGGARDAGVPAFIDSMVADVYSEADRNRFAAGCGEFETAAGAGGAAFLKQDLPTRTAFVKAQLEAGLEAERDPKPFILMVRELTLLGFFTSRIGATEIMNWVPVPGSYQGCVPVKSLAKPAFVE